MSLPLNAEPGLPEVTAELYDQSSATAPRGGQVSLAAGINPAIAQGVL